jgi:hypothetical protein
MKFISKLTFIGAVVCFIQFTSFTSASSELIEPTRNPGKKSEEISRLTVLSEPPGLNIILDGNDIGKTPAFLVEVQSGIHTLKVKNAETEIYIKPGETLKISLFKDEFVQIPVETITREKQPEPQPQVEASAPTPVKSDPEAKRVQKNTEQAQERWMRFINGTSPVF